MKNLIETRTANGFVIGETYIENNYYIYNCTSKGKIFSEHGITYQEVNFSVRTKTGRELGTENYKYPLN